MFNTPQILDTESHQGQNQNEQPFMLMGRASASESSSLVHHGQNININAGTSPSQWTAEPRSRIKSSSISNAEMPCFQQQSPGPSRDPFLHQHAVGNFYTVRDSYSRLPSSSSLGGQTIPEAHGAFVDQTTMGSSRGRYKRKSRSTPQLYERGSTSRYYDSGSSSNLLLPADAWQEKQNAESYHTTREYGPSYRVNSLSIGGEGMQRNVRRRTTVDHDPRLVRTAMTSNSLHHSFSNRTSDRSNLVDYSGQTSNTSMGDWNHRLISPAGHGGTSGADSSSFSQGPNTLNALNNYANNAVENGGYSNNASISQNHYGYLPREVQNSYDQRPVVPAFRLSSSCFYPGQFAASSEGPVMPAESFSSRHPQAFPTVRFRYTERNGRAGVSSDRYRSFDQQPIVPDRFAPEDNVAYHGSRTLFDQHRDMRLDVDNMSYEELLALGERIGSVSTGLSDGLLSNCVAESIYGSSDRSQDGGTCVICLEEYKDKDDIGTLKCCHDFHVGCVRKWLTMKNLCPICKASAVDESVKEELFT